MNIGDEILSSDVTQTIANIEKTLPREFTGNATDEEVINFLTSLSNEQVNCLFRLLVGFQFVGQQLAMTKMNVLRQFDGDGR